MLTGDDLCHAQSCTKAYDVAQADRVFTPPERLTNMIHSSFIGLPFSFSHAAPTQLGMMSPRRAAMYAV